MSKGGYRRGGSTSCLSVAKRSPLDTSFVVSIVQRVIAASLRASQFVEIETQRLANRMRHAKRKERVVRQLAVFLEQLRRVAARTAVDAVELLAAALLTIVVTPAAPAVIPTIIVQG